MENDMTKEEKNFINNLLSIDQNILEIYDSLTLLEYKNKKEATEYKDLIDNLKDFIKLENSIYNIALLTNEQLQKYILYTKTLEKKLVMENSVNKAFCCRRIFTTLITKQNQKSKDIASIIEDAIITDLERTSFIFLDDCINDENNIKYKNDLIRRKYNYSFINKDCEQEKLKNYFKEENEIYLSSTLIANYLNISTKQLDNIKINILGDYFIAFVEEIRNNFTLSKIIKEIYNEILYLKCCCEALLILLPEDQTEQLEKSLYEKSTMKEEEQRFFCSMFDDVKSAKQRCVGVTLRKRK